MLPPNAPPSGPLTPPPAALPFTPGQFAPPPEPPFTPGQFVPPPEPPFTPGFTPPPAPPLTPGVTATPPPPMGSTMTAEEQQLQQQMFLFDNVYFTDMPNETG